MNRLEEVLIKEKRIHNFLDNNDLEGMLICRQNNFTWLTGGGYNMVWVATDVGMTSLLVTRSGRYLIANAIEAPRMMEEEGLSELGFELLSYEWTEDKEAALIEEIAGDLAKVGCDVPHESCRFMESEFKQLRYQLLEPEIERYMFLGEKASIAAEKILLGLKPGDKECEIAGRVAKELWEDRIDAIAFMVAADERVFRYRHPIPTNRMIKNYVMLCCNARYKGLITTITRIAHLGKPESKLIKQFEDNAIIECRMIEASKPGTPVVEPLNVAPQSYEEMGYHGEGKLHHQGGAMGYHARDTIITGKSDEVILDNQCFCWNPSISGTKSEDGFIARAEGPLFITKPIIFPTIEIEINNLSFTRPGMLVIT